ncbi:MAG TPA: hypothetical protein G4O08_06565 [Anaerolineae bacterium]|nr:hypothetical protein [Anaerolineae bacterium]
MIKRPSLPLVLFVLFICFIAGLASVLLKPGDESNPMPSLQPQSGLETPLPFGDATTSPQTTILVLGVDHLQAEIPKLEAIWFVTFRLPGRNLFLLGIPIHTPVGGQSELRLKDLFRWHKDQGPDTLFMQALYDEVPLTIDVILVVDEIAFAAFIDYMGGVTLESGTLDGRQVIGVLDLVEDQPTAALEVQGRVVQALSEKAPNLGSTPDLTPLMTLFPENAFSSIPSLHLVSLINPLLPIQTDSIHIQLMTQQ